MFGEGVALVLRQAQDEDDGCAAFEFILILSL
jgi:hypothetical protein